MTDLTDDQQDQPPAQDSAPAPALDAVHDDFHGAVRGTEATNGVDPSIIDRALRRVKSLARGNGVNPDSISLVDFKGEVLHLTAETVFLISHSVNKSTMPGKQPGEPCQSVGEMKALVQQAIETTHIDQAIIDNIATLLDKREDKGFAAHHMTVKLERLNRQFTFITPCTNCVNDWTKCKDCDGSGLVECTVCRGQRATICTVCQGRRIAKQADGSYNTCGKCKGWGEFKCSHCRGLGGVKCRSCQGTGHPICITCNGTNLISETMQVSFDATAQFAIRDQNVPPEIVKMINNLGGRFITKKHGHVEILKDQQRTDRNEAEIENSDGVTIDAPQAQLTIPYAITVPWGEAQFKIGKKTIGAKIIGQGPKISKLSPFLESTLRPGIDRLTKAANSSGMVLPNTLEAVKYRAICDALVGVATLTSEDAIIEMRKHWSMGMRPAFVANLVSLADRAFQNLSRRARLIGFGAGLAASLVIFALYLLGPIRHILSVSGMPSFVLFGVDAFIVGISGFGVMSLSQMVARRTLQSVFSKILSVERARDIVPHAVHTGMVTYGSCLALFLVIVAIAGLTGHPVPEWAQPLFGN